ncbi:hypothetical protein [Micromonospora chersina]|uniref:hypothetical protein n=1 Tax=Micromonospora chersina TaxID=47854 RepID=UPI003D94BB7A
MYGREGCRAYDVAGAVDRPGHGRPWINLPYVSATQPTGGSVGQPVGEATDVQIVQAIGDRAVVRVSGPVKGFTGLTATTT